MLQSPFPIFPWLSRLLRNDLACLTLIRPVPRIPRMSSKENLKKYYLTREAWLDVLNAIRLEIPNALKHPPREFALWSKAHTHSHDYPEILVSLSVEHLYGINGKAVRLSPGSAALIPAKVPHDLSYSTHHGECVDFWIRFLPHGKSTMNFVRNIPATGLQFMPVAVPSVSLLEDFRRAGELLSQMESHLDELKTQHFLAYLLHELFGLLMDPNLKSQAVDGISLVHEIKRYVTEHLTDSLGLEDLAKAAGYSSFHFHRLFLEAEGTTPRAFVERLRLNKACNLLKKGYSVTSAAMDSGFSTSSQFTRVFKRQFRFSPSEWVKTTQ